MDLKDTVEDMCSNDYKRRFRAEKLQLEYRMEKLNKFLEEFDESNTSINTPKEILQTQLHGMAVYYAALCTRETIDILKFNWPDEPSSEERFNQERKKNKC